MLFLWHAPGTTPVPAPSTRITSPSLSTERNTGAVGAHCALSGDVQVRLVKRKPAGSGSVGADVISRRFWGFVFLIPTLPPYFMVINVRKLEILPMVERRLKIKSPLPPPQLIAPVVVLNVRCAWVVYKPAPLSLRQELPNVPPGRPTGITSFTHCALI